MTLHNSKPLPAFPFFFGYKPPKQVQCQRYIFSVYLKSLGARLWAVPKTLINLIGSILKWHSSARLLVLMFYLEGHYVAPNFRSSFIGQLLTSRPIKILDQVSDFLNGTLSLAVVFYVNMFIYFFWPDDRHLTEYLYLELKKNKFNRWLNNYFYLLFLMKCGFK